MSNCSSNQSTKECKDFLNRQVNHAFDMVNDYVAQVNNLVASVMAGIIEIKFASAKCFDDAVIIFSRKLKSYQNDAVECIRSYI